MIHVISFKRSPTARAQPIGFGRTIDQPHRARRDVWLMKSWVGSRKCNSKFAMCILDRLYAYPTRKRELKCLRNAWRSARLRDRYRGFDRKTVGTNSCYLAQALLHKRQLKIPDQANWICQRMADRAVFRIMQRNRRGFLIVDNLTLLTSNRVIGLVLVATVRANV